jgi:hypothetical protein
VFSLVNQSIVNRSARDGHGVVPRTPGKLLPQETTTSP